MPVPLCLYVRAAYHPKINISIYTIVSLFLIYIIISQEEIDLKRGTLANLDFMNTYSLMDGWMGNVRWVDGSDRRVPYPAI